ncbi:MAG: hypothetical protein MSG64_07440 [Pyrinomonadaceae bacterium MAG19_C2-C3]|nr:hypothetical protein [Pyrinomonadaceae bacterium MAG19_C2-C3]
MPPQRKAKQQATSVDDILRRADAQAAGAGVTLDAEPYTLDWYREDYPARKREFIEREIKIRDAFDRNTLKDFILNDAQVELLDSGNEAFFDASLEDYSLKCRRLGISTFYCASYLTDAILESGHHVRIVAQDPSTLRALMRSLKGMYDNLRPEIKPASKYNSVYDLEFADEEKGVVGSRISVSAVVPGQEEKGRGDTFTRLHLTEIPFWRGDAETAATALCDAAKGGVISGESTAKGVGDWFHRKYTQGKLHQGGVRAHFFEWWWNRNYRIAGAQILHRDGTRYLAVGANLENFDTLEPERQAALAISNYTAEERLARTLNLQSESDCTQQVLAHLKRKGHVEESADWTCDEVAECLAWRRQEIAKKGEKKFRVEYPENDIDPFAQTGGTVFDQAYTVVACEPRGAIEGHSYVVGLDPSMGIDGADPAAVTVIDRTTGEQVHHWAGYEKQDAQAKRVCALSDIYNAAEIVIESNMGEAAILECERLGYGHRLYKHLDVQTQRDVEDGKVTMRDAMLRARPGVQMTERFKRLIIGMFEKAWREGDFKACAQELCEESRVFVQNGERMEAKSGFHDDIIMVNGFTWYVVVSSHVVTVDFVSSGQKLGSARLKGY